MGNLLETAQAHCLAVRGGSLPKMLPMMRADTGLPTKGARGVPSLGEGDGVGPCAYGPPGVGLGGEYGGGGAGVGKWKTGAGG